MAASLPAHFSPVFTHFHPFSLFLPIFTHFQPFLLFLLLLGSEKIWPFPGFPWFQSFKVGPLAFLASWVYEKSPKSGSSLVFGSCFI